MLLQPVIAIAEINAVRYTGTVPTLKRTEK
jgi:hypothetical protein